MDTPPNMTEAEVLATIEGLVAVLAPRYVFPGHDRDDVAQEARIFGITALSRYRPERGPLENFLAAHIKRRLINWKRDHTRRIDSPCRPCFDGRPCGPDGKCCQRFLRWEKQQQAKAARNRPLSLTAVQESNEPRTRSDSTVDEAQAQELLRLIDEHLDVELRSSYLQMRAGQSVPRAKRLAVEEAVREIIGEEVA